jgi:hypothetical protein
MVEMKKMRDTNSQRRTGIDSEIEAFLLQCALLATFEALATLEDDMTLEVVAEMVDMKTFELIANLSMLTKGVDRCKDVSSRMTLIDNEIWLKYSLRRCLIAGIPFQDSINQSIEDSAYFEGKLVFSACAVPGLKRLWSRVVYRTSWVELSPRMAILSISDNSMVHQRIAALRRQK